MWCRSFAWPCCFAIASLGILFGRQAFAATYYWDTNGNSSGIGSAGGLAANWLTSSWATGSSGTLPTAAWPNTQPANDDAAVFQGTSGTVNLTAATYANALSFLANGYNIASTGGVLHLVGSDPTIAVNLPASNNTATISAPIHGDGGFTLAGNSLSGGLKFLVLANTDEVNPNAFTGTLTIEAGGALRLGGGAAREQIPDDVDLAVSGVLDFVTSGGASDGKQEKVRDVAVIGTNANFSIGNEADFVVNSISAAGNGAGQGIAINGNNGVGPNSPGRLIINGWDGGGDLTLDGGRVRINTTSSSFAVGGRVLLAGNILSNGDSQIWNHNGGPTTPEDHVFTNKAFDFTSAAHTINVASGTLLMTSRAAVQPLDVTSTHAGGTTLTKTGPGVWLYEHAVQSSFTGTNRVEEGTLRIGAGERLANGSRLEVAGGTFDLQGFSERVAEVVLESGNITGSGAGTLTSGAIDVRAGTVQARLGGAANLAKTTVGTVTLNGANSYTGTTTVSGGMLVVNGTHTGGGEYTVESGATLAGGGTITAPVTVGGVLDPGSGVGTLAVNGNVTFAEGSTLHVDLSGPTADKLVVTGNLDLDAIGNALEVSGLGEGGSWVIATYSGTLTGRFESVLGGYTVNYGTGTNSQITLFEAFHLVGDYNGDDVVDAADYTAWRNNVGSDGATLANRDPANGDGPVSADDYLSWKMHYGQTAGGSGGIARRLVVPEPGGWSAIVVLVVTCLVRRRHVG